MIDSSGPPAGARRARIIFAVDPLDPAVNNDVTSEVAMRWARSGVGATSVVTLDGVPSHHDIIEPGSPGQRLDLVYQRLLDLILARH